MLKFFKMKWLFNKRTGTMFVCGLMLIVIATLINVIGISAVGGVQQWFAWIEINAHIFFIWRLCLYIAVGYGWYWLRDRIIKRETEKNAQTCAKSRFLRIEISAICTLAALEISNGFI